MFSYVHVRVYEVGLNRFYAMCFTYMYVTASAFTYTTSNMDKISVNDSLEWITGRVSIRA